MLDTTRDPQLSDIVLDRWCYRDMAALAEETGSAFLRGYVAVQVDAVNLPGRRCGRCAWERGRTSSWARCWRGETSLRMRWQRPPPSGAAGLRELYGATRFRDAAEAGQRPEGRPPDGV